MKIIPPIVALVTLTSSTSAARTKKRTIFHKVDNVEHIDEADDYHAKKARRKRTQSGLGQMEKVTNVNIEDVMKQSLAKHRSMKKKDKAEESAPSIEKEADQEATLLESSMVRSAADTIARDSHTPAPATAPLIQSPSFATKKRSFENWEASATTPNHVQESEEELMHTRRRDRAASSELAHNKKMDRRDFDAQEDPMEDRKTCDRDETTGRRIRSIPEIREPNPRPITVVSASGKDQQRRRDLRSPHSSAKPGRHHANDERDLKKSKKSSKSSKSRGSKSGNEETCFVRLTNLTKEQWFSDIFWMVHSDKVELPLWSYGRPAFEDVAALAQRGDTSELTDFFETFDTGVLEVDAERGPLTEGDRITFDIPRSGSYNLFTMATSFIFANDGFVSIDAGEIKDGRVWWLWGLDAGVEANTQLCWTVQATSTEFPPNSECEGVRASIADENDDRIPGEGFVHVHSGIHDFGSSKNALNDFLAFTCNELDVDSFVEYFREVGYEDDFSLLYDDDRGRNEKDDETFLEDITRQQIREDVLFEIAVEAGSFRKFCRELEDIADFLFNTFVTLEPQVFDFRTPMMKVEIYC